MTKLLENPFAIIGATTHDDKKRIVELAEEKSFSFDHELCSKARSDLTSPRSRLAAEMSWLPGVAPQSANEFIIALKSNPATLRIGKTKINPISAANLLTACLEYFDEEMETEQWVGWILDLAGVAERIDAESVLIAINKDRQISGFSEIKEIEAIQTELAHRRRFYKDVIGLSLDRIPIADKLEIVTKAVEKATAMGERHAPALIDEVVDSYSLQMHEFLVGEAERVMKAVDAAETMVLKGDVIVRNNISKINRIVRHWDKFAQPIQLSMKSRGLPHELSGQIAIKIREFGILLANEHDMFDLATEVTAILRDVFAESPVLVERVEEDAQDLHKLSRQKRLSESITPISTLCNTAIELIGNDPNSGEKQGQKVLNNSRKILAEMRTRDANREQLTFAENMVAGTLLSCAVTYGNSTERWSPCLKLLEASKELATDKDLMTKIDANLDTVRNNLRKGGGLGKLSGTPTLWTINGFGFTLYGSTDRDPENGSHIATYYFVALFIPLFPIGRYRVIQDGNSYSFLGKYPLRAFDLWHLAISVALIGSVILFNQ